MSVVIGAAKLIGGLAVSVGVGSIVKSTSRLVIPLSTSRPALNFASKASITIGTGVLSWMVAEQAVKYTEDKIDESVEAVQNIKETFITAKETVKETKKQMADIVEEAVKDADK